MKPAERDAARVAARNLDLYGGRTRGGAILAQVTFNRTMRRLIEAARKAQAERDRDKDQA